MHNHHVPTTPMLLRAALVLALCAVPAHSAFALVKCVGNDGKVTFQDVMCSVEATSVPVHKRFGQPSAAKPGDGAQASAKTEPAVQTAASRPGVGGGQSAPNPLR